VEKANTLEEASDMLSVQMAILKTQLSHANFFEVLFLFNQKAPNKKKKKKMTN